jgi:hypothetical protein
MPSHLSILTLISWAIRAQEVFVYAYIFKCFPMFSYSSFRSYTKTFNPFWIDFCTRWEIGVCSQSSTCEYPVFPTSFALGAVFFFLIHVFGIFCWKSAGCGCVSLFLGALFHWSMCLFLCQSYAVFVIMALKYNLKSEIVILPELLLLLRIPLTIRELLCFHMNFGIDFSISQCHVKHDMGILMEIVLYWLCLLQLLSSMFL